jgi:hypothetical protein
MRFVLLLIVVAACATGEKSKVETPPVSAPKRGSLDSVTLVTPALDTLDSAKAKVSSTETRPTRSGKDLSLDLLIKSVMMKGDTVRIVERVLNRATSQDSLIVFLVDAPNGVTRINLPRPPTEWDTATQVYHSRPVAYWAALHLIAPGLATPDLEYESVGIPGIMDYWAQGNAPAGSGEEDEADEGKGVSHPPEELLATEMINGKTLGVERWPADRSAPALIRRLRILTIRTCSASLSWVSDSGLCSRLQAGIDKVHQAREAAQLSEGKRAIEDFIAVLNAANNEPGVTTMTSAGFWLLKLNAEILEATLSREQK